ncbi:hypothetical protein HDU81_001289 [Chytriomyces hyalinus]|nr:hypothetical protein HDU81_001289 [Chytriomyces hyalinus]
MSHFTDYQIRRFRFIFNQFSEGVRATAIVSQSDNLLSKDGRNALSWAMNIHFKLTAKELQQLMPRFGPPVTITQAQDFIYEYDSSCTGSLDFDDFIEFLGDYQAILQVRREKATVYYQERLEIAQTPNIIDGEEQAWYPGDVVTHDDAKIVVARHFINRYPEDFNYLATLFLDDPEFFFTKTESITNRILETGIVEDMNMLKRSILVRVYSARNLAAVTRLKKRSKKGIELSSLDPVIRIELCGIVQQTSALIASTKPDWDQDLKFDITIPPGQVHDVQQWIDRQLMVISLMDFEDCGSTHHTETLAVGTIPLMKILMSVKKPMFQVIQLNTLDCVTHPDNLPNLELSITDKTRELWAWAKITDAYPSPEEVWLKKHADKVLSDVGNRKTGHKMATVVSENEIDLWDSYCQIARPLRVPFRRRKFHTFALNEFNKLVPLTSLVTPMPIPEQGMSIKTPIDAAVEVSRIPYYPSMVGRSRETDQLISLNLSDKEEESLVLSDQSVEAQTLAGWHAQYPWSLAATQNFYGHVASPQTMLLQRRGTLLEHAILLCNLLLGMGLSSYIAIGRVKQRPYTWVVTLLKSDHELFIEKQQLDDFEPSVITYANSVARWTSGGIFASSVSSTAGCGAETEQKQGNSAYPLGPCVNYTNQESQKFRFESVHVLFNDKNIHYNIQKSDNIRRPFFSWDLTNPNHWIPLLSDTETTSPKLACFCKYSSLPTNPPTCTKSKTVTRTNKTTDPSNPSFLATPPISILNNPNNPTQNAQFVTALATGLRLYRTHMLFVPVTQFHRAASIAMQANLGRVESAFDERVRGGCAWTGVRAVPRTSQTSFAARLSAGLRSLPSQKKNSTSSGFRTLVRIIHAEVENEYTPDRHYYRCSVLLFKDANVDAVIHQLVSMGLWDTTVPGMVFVIAARVFQNAFGNTVLVAFGYFGDLIAQEIHSILNPIQSHASNPQAATERRDNSYGVERA